MNRRFRLKGSQTDTVNPMRLKLHFRSQLIHDINKEFNELTHIYYDKCF